LANILIDCKYFIELNNSLDKFDLANPLDLIQRLLDKTDNHSDGARDLLGKLISVSGLTFDSVVAERIVKKEWFDVLKQEIKSFDNLNEDIAVTLINRDKDGAMFVTQNVDKFKGLSQDVALLLIRNGCAKWVVDNINRFSDIGSVLIAEILKTGLWSVESVRKLRQMEAIDLKELEKAVMESEPTAEGFKIMMENMDVFGKMKDSKNILSYLTNMFPPNGPLFIEHFDKLSVLGFEYLAEEMIKAGLGSTVVDNLERFRGVDRKKIVDMLINIGQKEYVERNFEKFAGLTKNGDVKESLKNSSSEAYLVADSVEKFDGVIPDKTQLIVNLIRDGKHRHLDTSFWMLDLRRFKGLDFRTVAIALLEYDKYSDYLKEKGATIDVQNASDMDIVKALIKNEHVPFVLDYIEHFQIDDYNDLVNYIIELNWGVLLLDHLGYLRETEDSPLRSIKFNKDQALQILTKIDGFYDKFPKLAKYFDNLDKDVAYAIMEREYRNGSDPTKFFMENTNLFKGLTKKMVKDYMEQLTGKKGK
jgi:hypothetical protein